jgi:hypothetical protein
MKRLAIAVLLSALCQVTHAQEVNLLPMTLGTLSNGQNVELDVTVVTRKKWLPVLDWIASIGDPTFIKTADDDAKALSILAAHPEYDRRFLDGTLLLRRVIPDHGPLIVNELNESLPRVLGPAAYAEMNKPFRISIVLNIDPGGGLDECSQHWATIYFRGNTAKRLGAYAMKVISACNPAVPSPGLPPGRVNWADSLYQFANEPYEFVRQGLGSLEAVRTIE